MQTLTPQEWEHIYELLRSGQVVNYRLVASLLRGAGQLGKFLTQHYIDYYELGIHVETYIAMGRESRISKEYTDYQLKTQQLSTIINSHRVWRQMRTHHQYNRFGERGPIPEKSISKTISRIAHNTPIDPIRLAEHLYNKYKRASGYLLSYGSKTIIDRIFSSKFNAQNNCLNLAHQGIFFIPKEILNYPQIEKLILSHNRLRTLPQWLTQLPNLRQIDASYNRLGKVKEKLIAKVGLPNIVLTGNRWHSAM